MIPSKQTLKPIQLIFSPHLDDAVFSLGGLIQKDPEQTKIVTIFAGIPEKPLCRIWDIVCGFVHSTKAMQARIKENKDSLAILGLSIDENRGQIVNFGYLDQQYRGTFLSKKNAQFTKNEELSLDIKAIIENNLVLQDGTMSTVYLYVPLMTYHEDHRIVTDAVVSIYNRTFIHNPYVKLFVYQDVPYFYTYIKKRMISETSERELMSRFAPQTWTRHIVPYGELIFEKKIHAVKAYASQIGFFGMKYLPKVLHFLSKKQSELYKCESPYVEIVYELK